MTEVDPHATKPRHQNKFENLQFIIFIWFYSIIHEFAFLRFQRKVVQEIIHKIIVDKLEGQVYKPDETSAWSREISDDIRNKMKGWLFFQSSLEVIFFFCIQIYHLIDTSIVFRLLLVNKRVRVSGLASELFGIATLMTGPRMFIPTFVVFT